MGIWTKEVPAKNIRPNLFPASFLMKLMASKAKAFIEGRAYVIPEDIRSLVYDVLRHRIGLSFEAEAENINPDNIIKRIIEAVEIP